MSKNGDRPLPKFGEWDVNNPATAEGFTVIFDKARGEKNAPPPPPPPSTTTTNTPPRRNQGGFNSEQNYNRNKRSWFCWW